MGRIVRGATVNGISDAAVAVAKKTKAKSSQTA
jgi:hypothetical protein